jgi:hypothetical protein
LKKKKKMMMICWNICDLGTQKQKSGGIGSERDFAAVFCKLPFTGGWNHYFWWPYNSHCKTLHQSLGFPYSLSSCKAEKNVL